MSFLRNCSALLALKPTGRALMEVIRDDENVISVSLRHGRPEPAPSPGIAEGGEGPAIA